jgi:TPR repeat protein
MGRMLRTLLFAMTILPGRAEAAEKAPAPPLVVEAAVKACEGGSLADCARLGQAYRLGSGGVKQDISRAQRFFERACTLGKGQVAACTDLAEILSSGLGEKKDTDAGIAILERACAGREPGACAYLGLIFTEGLGVPYRPEQQRIGFGFYRKACDLGSAKGCWHLGLLLRAGTGCKPDQAAARRYLEKACRDGEEVACGDLKSGVVR